MDAFVSRKRRRSPPLPTNEEAVAIPESTEETSEESTDFKLAILSSLHPDVDQGSLLETLLLSDGFVETASQYLSERKYASPRKKQAIGTGYQASISSFGIKSGGDGTPRRIRPLTRKGQTLHLYTPEDIEAHTPCSIIHNFLPSEHADALLRELMEESPTFFRAKFKLFDRVVQSPHTFAMYVDSESEQELHKTEYVYDGHYFKDVRRTLPEMLKASTKVEAAVNAEVKRRIRDFYPGGKKLPFQSPHDWKPNASFVNAYDGASESVGWHSDMLNYIGPRAIIGSLSLGVAREFRVRKVVAREDRNMDPKTPDKKSDDQRADEEGQIAIHLPHNSLLVMHAEMQEEWKHSIAPAKAIDPHPIAGNMRINVTYRCYKDDLNAKLIPKCRCDGMSTVLRCLQKKKETRGRYIWMCYTNYQPDKEGCSFFQYADFDDDGNPPWSKDYKKPTKLEDLPD
ncbi:hypothetical protein K402DRAFT_413881 [Aulographum hederae CBS 113979]|uniref:Uncharacterized protein n=1 Tax=Aulographum hederae CBS 113979 TaxID=1176131 RepID=A0A6G1GTT9_9PEZI|nr:hypothetical protein K402DRAFT_413881 [Aulographum hederae CBS 113979]